MLKIAHHPIYKHPLPEGHRFPMAKYELLPQQLIYEGTCGTDHFFEPKKASKETLLLAHDLDYLRRLLHLQLNPKEMRKIGFPLSEALVEREQLIAGGTLSCCEYAREFGIAMNIAGGTHHAYAGSGEAFCMLNDQAIAAKHMVKKGWAKRVLIIDLDVHQGNGTAAIFEDDPSVFTFSMHGKSNYPFKKEKSDWDIPLEKGTGDATYLQLLQDSLPQLFEKVAPEFVFYLSGVDVLATDKLGTLGMTMAGCKERDRLVLSACRERDIPLQCSMGGGYSPDIKVIIEAHANTFRLAQDLFF